MTRPRPPSASSSTTATTSWSGRTDGTAQGRAPGTRPGGPSPRWAWGVRRGRRPGPGCPGRGRSPARR
ncbi:hypothetical protein [Ornithinimicrobium kibberense]|uniref:hypothetical protein n=1 Tax=Ornithinimicrobium kibberense TaxID=282060 RepID=UPI00361EB3A8